MVDEEEWPALAEAKLDSEPDWEMLQQESSNSAAVSPNNDTCFEIVDHHDDEEEPFNQKQPKHENMRHCVSSPNLSGMHASFLVTNALGAVAEEESDAFSLVSGPASVMTSSTLALSFRDAILASPGGRFAATAGEPRGSEPQAPQQPRQQRSRIQPRYVVVASPPPAASSMRRCSKSTGDLQSLIAAAAVVDDEHEESYGSSSSGAACDTMDFYHRKALGATSRSNGLKLRPDEAKRRAMIMLKKEQQRNNNR